MGGAGGAAGMDAALPDAGIDDDDGGIATHN
jgi:hypothetical protein